MGLELAAWWMLLASGLVGMSRLEWVPVVRLQFGRQAGFERDRDQLLAAKLGAKVALGTSGEPLDVDAHLSNREDAIKKTAEHIAEAESKVRRRYRWQKLLFLLAVVMLIAARSYPALKMLIDAARASPA